MQYSMGSCVSLMLDGGDGDESYDQGNQSFGDNSPGTTAYLPGDGEANQADQQSINLGLRAYQANSQMVAPTWNDNGPQGPGYYGGF